MAEVQDSSYKAVSKPESASWHRGLTQQDYEKLLQGFTPRDMDDRWVVKCEKADPATGRGSVHLYRSWTGNEDLRGDFHLVKKEGGSGPSKAAYAIIDKISWETDPEIRGLQTEAEAKEDFRNLLSGLVGVKLLE